MPSGESLLLSLYAVLCLAQGVPWRRMGVRNVHMSVGLPLGDGQPAFSFCLAMGRRGHCCAVASEDRSSRWSCLRVWVGSGSGVGREWVGSEDCACAATPFPGTQDWVLAEDGYAASVGRGSGVGREWVGSGSGVPWAHDILPGSGQALGSGRAECGGASADVPFLRVWQGVQYWAGAMAAWICPGQRGHAGLGHWPAAPLAAAARAASCWRRVQLFSGLQSDAVPGLEVTGSLSLPP